MKKSWNLIRSNIFSIILIGFVILFTIFNYKIYKYNKNENINEIRNTLYNTISVFSKMEDDEYTYKMQCFVLDKILNTLKNKNIIYDFQYYRNYLDFNQHNFSYTFLIKMTQDENYETITVEINCI